MYKNRCSLSQMHDTRANGAEDESHNEFGKAAAKLLTFGIGRLISSI